MNMRTMKDLYRLMLRYPLSSLLVAVIWIICLIPVPETPLSDVALIDKWTHIAMYFVLGMVLWAEYLFRHKRVCRQRVILMAWLAPVVMGGLIEFVQGTCTGGTRSGDWLDFLANAMGCTLVLPIGILLAKCFAKW